LNKYTYCRNNAVRFVDPLGLYDRDAAADYARKYGEDGEYNSEYLGFDRTIDRIKYAITNGTKLAWDCANFASQALVAGGLKMNDEWYFKKKTNKFRIIDNLFNNVGLYRNSDNELTTSPIEYKFTDAWSSASKQFDYFRNTENNYTESSVIKLSYKENKDEYKEYIKNTVKLQNIQIGDLMYFANEDDGAHHATVITSINDDIYFSAHTSHRSDEPLYDHLEGGEEWVYIIRIKDDAE
jgi:hypothetical protein